MEGDITRVVVDAIVNAANERMLGGFGVDGAIHAAAGHGLYEACRAMPEVAEEVRCPRGGSRITPGFRLPAKYVIHTVGPWYESPEASASCLRRCYETSLQLANQHGVRSIAFPAISCGAYGYPQEQAAEVAIEACRDFHGAVSDVRFVLFGYEAYERWLAVASRLLDKSA
jgi:O-acetyl-ADP-ribose deacetylase (regulator of RNase III)